MRERVLITGGAGFVGTHLARALLAAGYAVRLLDNLEPQVHHGRPPRHLPAEAELIVGDVADEPRLRRALAGVDAVVHLAAIVGVGQSMYQIARYSQINLQATAVLLQALLARQRRPGSGLGRLLVASSMSVYGEGRYRCAACGPVQPPRRSPAALAARRWDPLCPRCGGVLNPEATDEAKPLELHSIYALTKYGQEEMARLFGRTYGVATTALRFFNIYGPEQALDNPYTGVVAIFAAQLLAGRAPEVFEDGLQQRDFVSVHDVVRGCRAALEHAEAADTVLNLASGDVVTVGDLARELAAAVARVRGPGWPRPGPDLTGHFRVGDVRHCFASIEAAQRLMGYQPRVRREQGLAELAQWLERQPAPVEVPGRASRELLAFGLTG